MCAYLKNLTRNGEQLFQQKKKDTKTQPDLKMQKHSPENRTNQKAVKLISILTIR